MNTIQRGIKAVFNFVVGDMRLMIGTFAALVVAAVVAKIMPSLAGVLMFLVLALALAVALRREVK